MCVHAGVHTWKPEDDCWSVPQHSTYCLVLSVCLVPGTHSVDQAGAGLKVCTTVAWPHCPPETKALPESAGLKVCTTVAWPHCPPETKALTESEAAGQQAPAIQSFAPQNAGITDMRSHTQLVL